MHERDGRGGGGEGGVWKNLVEEQDDADYGGMVQPSQQHVTSCLKGSSGLGMRGLRIVAVI